MAFVTVGTENNSNIDLYYEDFGSGDPVVLIHGWPLSGRMWDRQVVALLEAGHRVITYDRRGFGKSSRPATGYDYDTFAADLDGLMTKLDLMNASLIGFSMGGGEVARYLGNYGSKRVARAGFLGAIPPFLVKTPENAEGVDKQVFDGLQAGIVNDRPQFLGAFLTNFFNVDQLGSREGAAGKISEETVRWNWNIAVDASLIATHACVSAWLEDFRDDLKAINVPTLILHGDQDRIVPFEVSGKRTHEMVKGSKLVVLEGAPHGFSATHAEELNKELVAFLAEPIAAAQEVG
jgi:non-heme chloroperoxidase